LISSIGLNLLMKMGTKDKVVKTPAVPNWLRYRERKIAANKNKIVPIAVFQTTAKIIRGMMEKRRIWGDKAKKAPAKVPMPRPPANFKNRDQLWPVTAATPERI